MLLIIDNYDSFTWNLVQAFGALSPDEIRVVRNDAHPVDELVALRPTRVVISPGPGDPAQAGVSVELIRRLIDHTPILGVCLGHQCLAVAFGGEIVRATRLVHGKTTAIRHDGRGVFKDLSNPFAATRYHSLLIDPGSLPGDFDVSATAADDESEIMGIRLRGRPVEGVQFHPESFMTLEGQRLLANFLALG